MKNQGAETKAAPRPANSSKMSSGLVLEGGDSPEAVAPLEGGGPRGEVWGMREGRFPAWKESGWCFLRMRVSRCIQLFWPV